jgi:hypothetical protein
MISQFSKALAALVTGVVGWGAVVVASPSAAITSSEWLALAVVVASALGVYAVPNSAPAAPVAQPDPVPAPAPPVAAPAPPPAAPVPAAVPPAV